MKHRILRTTFVLRNGKEIHDFKQVIVEDLEKYRESLKQPKYKTINFAYEVVSDHDNSRKNKQD